MLDLKLDSKRYFFRFKTGIDLKCPINYNHFEKEASGLRLLSRLHGVQKVGSSNLPAPTIALRKAVVTF